MLSLLLYDSSSNSYKLKEISFLEMYGQIVNRSDELLFISQMQREREIETESKIEEREMVLVNVFFYFMG